MIDSWVGFVVGPFFPTMEFLFGYDTRGWVMDVAGELIYFINRLLFHAHGLLRWLQFPMSMIVVVVVDGIIVIK